MAFRIKVDKEKCIACGVCNSMCPFFDVDPKDMKSVPKKEIVENLKGENECIKEAKENCPTEAIIIEEIKG